MVDSAGNVSRHGNQTAFRAKDFEEARSGRMPRSFSPARPEGLGKLERVAVPHRGLLAAPHHQFRAVGKQGFQPDEAGFQVALLRGFLQAFEGDGTIHRELRHRRAPQTGQMRSAAQLLPKVVGQRADVRPAGAFHRELHVLAVANSAIPGRRFPPPPASSLPACAAAPVRKRAFPPPAWRNKAEEFAAIVP